MFKSKRQLKQGAFKMKKLFEITIQIIGILVLLVTLANCNGGASGSTNETVVESTVINSAVAPKAWPNNTVRFTINPEGFSEDDVDNILSWIYEVEDKVETLTFIEMSWEDFCAKDYLTVVEVSKGSYNAATIGYTTYPQVTINDVTAWVFKHEWLHIIGLQHTHQRLDRDSYVDINLANVPEQHRHNFDKIENFIYDQSEFTFDQNSLMLYGPNTFGQGSITHNFAYTQPLDLSEMDVQKIKSIYSK